MNIKEAPFKPKCTPEALAKARKWLRDLPRPTKCIGNYAVFTNTEMNEYLENGCHSGIGLCGLQDVECVATNVDLSRMNNYREDLSEATLDFVLWVTQESFFSRFILNSDDIEECSNFGWVISSDIPSALLQNICIMSRHTLECTKLSFEEFSRLKGLYGGEVAFHLAFCTPLSSTLDPKHFRLVKSSPFHRVWGTFSLLKELFNFISGDFGHRLNWEDRNLYRNYHTVHGGSQYCLESAAYSNSTFVHELMKDTEFRSYAESRMKELRLEGSCIVNPFIKVFPPLNGMSLKTSEPTYEELHGIVLPYMKEKGHFNVK